MQKRIAEARVQGLASRTLQCLGRKFHPGGSDAPVRMIILMLV
jgi:hypothetical protein